MSILVLQSSWWGRESWLLCLICLPGVSWWLSGSSSQCHGVVCSLWLWYFLIILTHYFCTISSGQDFPLRKRQMSLPVKARTSSEAEHVAPPNSPDYFLSSTYLLCCSCWAQHPIIQTIQWFLYGKAICQTRQYLCSGRQYYTCFTYKTIQASASSCWLFRFKIYCIKYIVLLFVSISDFIQSNKQITCLEHSSILISAPLFCK